MKSFNKLKTAVISAAFLGASTLASAGPFDNTAPNGMSIGKVSKNVASGFVDASTAFEAFLYVAAIFFVVMFILSLVKWKKSEGREGNPGLIAVYLLAAVLCIGAPTVLGGGLSTIFGNTGVSTIKPPTVNTVGN